MLLTAIPFIYYILFVQVNSLPEPAPIPSPEPQPETATPTAAPTQPQTLPPTNEVTSELELLQKTQFAKDDSQLIYIFLTNRPYEVTHGNETFVPPSDGSDYYKKALFLPKVDHFTKLQIANTSYFYNKPQYNPLYIYLQIGNGTEAIRSSRKLYWKTGYIVGSWSADIHMDNGAVTGISWEDGCQECSTDQCLDNTCALDVTQVNICKVQPDVCNIKVYLALCKQDDNIVNTLHNYNQ
eukprot:TRINITY_DN3148_c0_g2_i1.p1 TRINITY_DN3148_c0_g2~~TRINITY_DN3148_c0_g2_i1.p1  ORF type:complete len:239 (+),score=49.11 TRINITY_DN3148_c0_g2_i1:5-721(+)